MAQRIFAVCKTFLDDWLQAARSEESAVQASSRAMGGGADIGGPKTPRFTGDINVKIADPTSMQKHTVMTRGFFGIGALAVLLSLAGCDKGAEEEAEGQAEAEAEVAVKAEGEASGEAKVDADVEASAVVIADARVAGDVTIKPADFELDVVAEMLKEGTIESAAELEVRINDEEQGINHVDIDGDGTIDHIQVIEVRSPSLAIELDADAEAAVDVDVDVDAEVDVDVDAEVEGVVEAAADAAAEIDAAVAADAAIVGGADVVFEFRAIPSSSASAEASVSFASAGFIAHEAKAELEIRTGFHAVVHQPKITVITHRVPVSYEAHVVVGGGAFFSWAYAPKRAVYVGTYEVDREGRWIPPGHLKHGHWKATGEGHVGHHGNHGHHGKAEVHGSAKAKGKSKSKGGFEVKVKKGKSGSLKGGFGASAHGGASASAKGGSSKGGSSKGGSSKGGSSKGGSSKGGSGKGGKDKGGKSKKK